MKIFLPVGLALVLCATGTAQAEPNKAADQTNKVLDRTSPDFVRCKREKPPGSLIATVKLCRTNAEWQRIGEGTSAEARKLIEDNTGRPGSN